MIEFNCGREWEKDMDDTPETIDERRRRVIESLPKGQPTPVRNHKYMTQLLDHILCMWTKYPDLRLGQLIANAIPTERLFSIEDEALAKQLYFFVEENLCSNVSSTKS